MTVTIEVKLVLSAARLSFLLLCCFWPLGILGDIEGLWLESEIQITVRWRVLVLLLLKLVRRPCYLKDNSPQNILGFMTLLTTVHYN